MNSEPTKDQGRRGRQYAWLQVLLVVMTVTSLVIGGIVFYYIEARLLASTGESLALAAADIADKLDRILYERYGDIQMLARTIREGDPAAQSGYLNEMKAARPYYLWLGITDAQGRIVAATDPASVGRDRGDHEWFHAVRDRRGIHVQDMQISEDSGNVRAVAFTAPIIGPQGEFRGAVTSRVGLPVLEDVILSTVRALRVQRGESVTIEYQFLDRAGELISDSVLHQEGKVNLKWLALPSALFAGSAQPGYVEEMHVRRRVPVVTGYAQTEGYGDFLRLHWAILVRMDRSAVLTPIRAVLWKLGLAGGVLFVPMIGFLFWTTGRLRAEWAQARSEAARAERAAGEKKRILAAVHVFFIGLDGKNRVMEWTPAAEKMFGISWSDAIGRPFQELDIAWDWTAITPTLDSFRGSMEHGEMCLDGVLLRKKDDTEAFLKINIGMVFDDTSSVLVLMGEDVTEGKRAEEDQKRLKVQLLQTDKMASIGQLAAGVAHEINNPIGFVKSNLNSLQAYVSDILRVLKAHEVLEASLEASTGEAAACRTAVAEVRKAVGYHALLEDLPPLLEETKEGIERVRGIVQNLKEFSHVDEATRKLADLNRCLQSTLKIVWNELKYKAEVVEEYGSLPEVNCFPQELNQVFLNLLVNAGHAIKERGRITIRTFVRGDEVVVEIGDTGCGIPPDNMPRIFDPFFTTKGVGKGTGLGLSISYGIVQKHQGSIEVESEVGTGTTFRVVLPVDPVAVEAAQPVSG